MELKKLKNEIETKRNKIDELNNQYNNILENINLEKTKNDNSNYNNDINNNNFNILNEPQNETRPSISVKKASFSAFNAFAMAQAASSALIL